MNTSASRSAAEGASAPTTFSYAQAAKGRASSTTTPAIHTNQATSGVSTPAKDTNSAGNTPSTSVNGGGSSELGDRGINGTYDAVSRADPLGVGVTSESKSSTLTKSGSLPASPSFGTASTSTLPRDDDLALAAATPPETVLDQHSEVPNSTEKSSEAAEARRGKKGKKQKNTEKDAEKEKEELKPEVLVAAPVPTVNIWQQRKEAQAAKAKPSPPIIQSSQSFSEISTSNDTIAAQATKPADVKRRGKMSGIDDGDKSSPAMQNGVPKEPSHMNKSQKKGSEGISKSKEDASTKRTGPRGGRGGEKDEKTLANQLPPPVEDATSWPTPETALEEEKRKVQEKLEKEEKDDSFSNKPRPKEKWVPVPYIPTVTFNTPLPTRGGRGRGGSRVGRDTTGRGNHTANGNATGDKVHNTSGTTANSGGDPDKPRGRDGANAVRAASLPPQSAKRASSHEPSSTHDQRKLSIPPNIEKPKSSQAGIPTKSEPGLSPDGRDSSAATQMDTTLESQQDQQLARGDNSKAVKSDQVQATLNGGQSHSRLGASDQKSEPNMRGSDQFKEGSNAAKDNNQQARDRADGRSDRGRGGFRGRGGHSNFPNTQQPPQHSFANGNGPQLPSSYPVRQSTGPYSPPLQPLPFTNQYAHASSRGGRGGSRSQPVPNNMYARFPPNGNPGSQQMPPLQTSNPMFDYPPPMQSMSAVPYSPYVDQYSVLAMVTMQLEYYFSIDNLCKDVFLRKHMDSQGFVFLTFIAGFKRIQALTQDFELLRFACQETENIDIIRGEDGIDRLRRREGWEKWVLAMEERDESTRNTGPLYHHRQHPAQRSQQMGHMILPVQNSISPPAFSPNGTESSFRPYGNGTTMAPVMNGNGNNHHPETPLSAAVPDFAPGLLPVNDCTDLLQAETTFTDEEVGNLTLVFSPKGSDDSKPKVPYHNASARTFSNGSIDRRSIAEESYDDQRPGRTHSDGRRETSPDGIRRPRSPFTSVSATKANSNNGPPVMWVKGQRQQALISEHNTEELYTVVRTKALKHRESSTPGETHPDMKLLYEFWSHFLCRNFNPTMYSEFRKYAFEDAREQAMDGMKNLILYYDEILNSKKKTIPEPLACHYVELVKSEESNSDRPAFAKLRAAWRNGALDMKSRKKIDNFVDPKLREELER